MRTALSAYLNRLYCGFQKAMIAHHNTHASDQYWKARQRPHRDDVDDLPDYEQCRDIDANYLPELEWS